MLIKGTTPNEEPLVSIGIILPQDKQNFVQIFDSHTDKNFEFESKNGNLLSNKKIISIFKISNKHNNSKTTIFPVIAGRGFHWEKQIPISVLGDIEIKILNGHLFVVNHIPLEKYLMCVATSEMSGNCPPALLETQTIAARSWLLAASEQKHVELGIDACNDDCCQRYQGVDNITKSAVHATENTAGLVLMHENRICDSRYSKSCGGISENNENVWKDQPKDYLQGIVDGTESEFPEFNSESVFNSWIKKDQNYYCSPNYVNEKILKNYLGNVDEHKSYFRWNYKFKQKELTNLISKKLDCSFKSILSLKPINRGVSGRILELEIRGIINSKMITININNEYEIRRVLHPDFLFSSAFTIKIDKNKNRLPSYFKLIGAGWGHGVGLCQIGGLGMALAKKSTKEILMHYYSNSEIIKIY